MHPVFARACADCHSNQTRWPWYSHVASGDDTQARLGFTAVLPHPLYDASGSPP